MHIIFRNVLMLFTQNYKNQSMLDKSTACQSSLVVLRHSKYTALSSVVKSNVYKNLAIANRSRVSCAHDSSMASP